MMVIVANQGPAIIPDSYQLPPFTLVLNGKQYRELIDRWGYPLDTRPRDVDARLVELADIQLTPVKNPPEPCTEPNSLAYAANQARVRVQTGATPTTVVLVRFGTGPTRIGDLGPNQTAVMTLPGPFPIGPGRSARRGLRREPRAGPVASCASTHDSGGTIRLLQTSVPTLTVRFSRLSAVDVAFGIVVAVSLVAYLHISRRVQLRR